MQPGPSVITWFQTQRVLGAPRSCKYSHVHVFEDSHIMDHGRWMLCSFPSSNITWHRRLHSSCLIWSAAPCSAVNAHLPPGHRVSHSSLRASHQICFFLALDNDSPWTQESPVRVRVLVPLGLNIFTICGCSKHTFPPSAKILSCIYSSGHSKCLCGLFPPLCFSPDSALVKITSHTSVLDGFFSWIILCIQIALFSQSFLREVVTLILTY